MLVFRGVLMSKTILLTASNPLDFTYLYEELHGLRDWSFRQTMV